MAGRTIGKVDKGGWGSRVRSQRFRAGAVNTASAASEGQIRKLAASLNHPIFWVGKRAGATYELTRQPNGTVVVRHLPRDAKIGTSAPYLTVATYAFPGAYRALRGVKAKDAVFLKIPNGGIAEYVRSYPASVRVAYPNVDYQVEVYDPTPGTAVGSAVSGALAHLGPANDTSTTPATSAKQTVPTESDLSAPYPGSDYLVEVFDMSAANARALVSTEQVQAIG